MKERLLALDVMRGLTIGAMILVNTPGTWDYVYAPLRHAAWHGCTPTDLVFPFFLFMVGVSISLSFKKFDFQPSKRALNKVLRRTLLIFLIGVLLNYFPFFDKTLSELRVMGVLQRIALCYGLGAVLILYLRRTALLVTGIFLLVAYWGILYAFGGSDPFELQTNFAGQLDARLFGADHLFQGFGIPFDPEGLLSTIPATVNVLIGYGIGRYITQTSTIAQKLVKLIVVGISLVAIALIWNMVFPINKPIWTSSYVLYTSGIAILFLVALLWVLDVRRWTKWALPLQVYGVNALASYVFSIILAKILLTVKIGGQSSYNWIYENVFQSTLGDYNGSLGFALIFNLTIWLIAWILYRYKIYIKI